MNEVIIKHAAGSGTASLWQQQLLNTPVATQAGLPGIMVGQWLDALP